MRPFERAYGPQYYGGKQSIVLQQSKPLKAVTRPEPILPATSARLALRRSNSLDEQALMNPNSGASIDQEWDMSPAQIELLDGWLKEVLWMCDMILDEDSPSRDHLWRRYFRNLHHRAAISGIYTDVRVLVISLLDRYSSDATQPIFADQPLKIVMAHTKCPVQPYNRIADCHMHHHTITLYKRFIDGWKSWDESATYEIKDHMRRPGQNHETTHIHSSRAGTLLHELVHYISYHRWDEFYSRLSYGYARRYLDRENIFYITDIDPAKYATSSDKFDKKLLKIYEEKKWTSNQGPDGKTRLASYGLGATEHLAKFKRGGLATLLNADNYLAYGAAVCSEYLKNTPTKKQIQRRSSLGCETNVRHVIMDVKSVYSEYQVSSVLSKGFCHQITGL